LTAERRSDWQQATLAKHMLSRYLASMARSHADIIRAQSDQRMYGLRGATSLAQLWYEQQRTKQAHELLSAAYDRFTEGFETADLKTAKALISFLQ
jgi:hypothetical protein